MSLLLTVRNLSYTYPDGTQALTGVDFDLNTSETIVLLGANGSGKTTFVRHLNGILKGQGEIQIGGLELIDTNLREIRRKVGLVFQDPDDQLFMPTILEDAAFAPLAAGYTKAEAEKLAISALSKVGIVQGLERAPYHLSAGEKRRVAIAGVLAQEPELLVLDEPTTFLDPPAQRALASLLRELPQGKILVTHDTDFARYVGTRAVFFDSGRIVARGSVDELVQRFDWRGF